MNSVLYIKDFEVTVHLGCSAEEQTHGQPVRFSFEINYQTDVKGCVTDQLQDATDYVKLAELIKSVAQNKKYHLIEHLNQCVLKTLSQDLAGSGLKAKLKLSVHKLRVPVENLQGGVFFTCETSI